MHLQIESNNIKDYLINLPPIIDYTQPLILNLIYQIQSSSNHKKEQAKIAFDFVRDEIAHSFDTQYPTISISAFETLKQKEGICFAKSHLLATLLRGMDIPAGFCYQRVLRKGTIESGYALHGLNAVYLDHIGWFRIDPRGNKPGIDSQFSTEKEQLAYPIRPEFGEIDYPMVFAKPLPSVITAMQCSKNTQELFYTRPDVIG